ncbi:MULTISPECIES: D-glycero-beta-D-manno-heptose-7-phosphate kinase [Ramlibacter]|uniref:D-glycero-beta-D-manno-heptose-7-phosphate kinase n=1 Tax=Ramlibacter pinisoli TaxID=2682844 RepID=A0A6N8IPY2_9BURK|nr:MULTISPECIES: D-glycero-beta-D-manno-heptose-7-phosphate kinase [Ramlibacter]MBA2963975.1 D-glycero-beta-D-manno-heptose-7-phosphate kinase [Ramlibacter sp. CGMCC 1.13660]MVQ28941.1 D-glycero-beta-D-manno-heptose-7-phosphate kinase [Ramlibacter pinisoli]
MNPSKEQLSKAHVLVVGDAMLDRYWHGAVERISPEAPVPVVKVSREEERIGAAANVAYNVSTLGAQASFLGVVGDDEPGHRLEKLLKDTGIRTHLKRDPGLRTTVKLRVIGRQQQLLRMDFENEPDHEVLALQTEAFSGLVAQQQAVLFSDYGKGGLAHIPAMIAAARAAGKVVLVDPKGSDYERYRGASVITPNRAELQDVVGRWRNEDELRAKAQALRTSLDLGALLVTRSEEGMTLFDAQGELHVPAQAREVFDVTGAGDTVIATLAAMAAAGLPLREAVPIANRAGGIVVGKFGTATVSYEELFA